MLRLASDQVNDDSMKCVLFRTAEHSCTTMYDLQTHGT